MLENHSHRISFDFMCVSISSFTIELSLQFSYFGNSIRKIFTDNSLKSPRHDVNGNGWQTVSFLRHDLPDAEDKEDKTADRRC